MEKVTKDSDPELFYRLCAEQNIEYASVVHSFILEGEQYKPIYWHTIEPTSKSQTQY